MNTSCISVLAVKRAVGAAAILLTFTVTACSPSDPEPDRSWSEFEACVYALYPSDPARIFLLRSDVEDYREGRYERRGENPERVVVECEKVMPILTTER